MPSGAGYVSWCTIVALLALLALANGTNAQQLRPPFFQAHGIHHLFGWHHALQERRVENIQQFDLFPRRLNDLRTGIDKKIKKALPDFFKKAEAEVRPRGLPWFPRLPTIPKIPHIPKPIDKPDLIRGYRHMGIYHDNSEKILANIPTSSESSGRPHIERPKSILHKLGKLGSKIDNLSTNKVDVATSPSPLPPEDSYLCNLDYSGINKYPGVDSCTGSRPNRKKCCATLRSYMDGLAMQNPHLFLAITTVPTINENCRKVLRDWLKPIGVEHNVFHICTPTAILPLTTVAPHNTCPFTAMQDFKRRVKLSALTKRCTNSTEPCTTCSGAIRRTSLEVSHTDSPSIISDCTAVILLRLAQSEPGPVAPDVVHIQRTCRSSLDYKPPPTSSP